MSKSSDPFFRPYLCRDCGSETGFRSRRRTFTERYILRIFMLQPVRCAECFRRDYWPIFTTVEERLRDITTMMPMKEAAAPKRHVA